MSLIRFIKRPAFQSSTYAPFRSNSVFNSRRVRTTAEDYTYLSTAKETLNTMSVYGGEHLTPVCSHQQKYLGITALNSEITVNRIWSGLHGTTQAELVGFNYDQDPNGLTSFENEYSYARVSKVDLVFEVLPSAAIGQRCVFYFMFYRSDQGPPSIEEGNLTDEAHTDINRIPQMSMMTFTPNRGDYEIRLPQFHRVTIDVRKMFNDLEWNYDPVEAGNFWIPKENKRFTGRPNAEILCKVYAKDLDPGNQGTTGRPFFIGVKARWHIEFDRGEALVPEGQ